MVYWLERSQSRRGNLGDGPACVAYRYQHASARKALSESPQRYHDQCDHSHRSLAVAHRSASGYAESLSHAASGFEFFQGRIGASGSRTIRLGSPSDYQKQAEIIVLPGAPDPSTKRVEFEQCLPELIKRYISRTDGHAFVLFTSHSLLRRMAQRLGGWFAGISYRCQPGRRRSAHSTARPFSTHATFSTLWHRQFWQGVDVPRCASQRNHYQAAVQRPRSSAFASQAGSDQSGWWQSL